MRPAEKPLVVHAPPDDSDSGDYEDRASRRDLKPRGRSESPPISSSSHRTAGRKKMPYEKSAERMRNMDVPVIKPAWYQHMSDAAYAEVRQARLQELEAEARERTDEGAERYEAYMRRAHHRSTGRALRMGGLQAQEVRRLSREAAVLAEEEVSQVASHRPVVRVPIPRPLTVQQQLDDLADEIPMDAPPPPTTIMEFFQR